MDLHPRDASTHQAKASPLTCSRVTPIILNLWKPGSKTSLLQNPNLVIGALQTPVLNLRWGKLVQLFNLYSFGWYRLQFEISSPQSDADEDFWCYLTRSHHNLPRDLAMGGGMAIIMRSELLRGLLCILLGGRRLFEFSYPSTVISAA